MLLGSSLPWQQLRHMPAQGLFCERNKTNFFNVSGLPGLQTGCFLWLSPVACFLCLRRDSRQAGRPARTQQDLSALAGYLLAPRLTCSSGAAPVLSCWAAGGRALGSSVQPVTWLSSAASLQGGGCFSQSSICVPRTRHFIPPYYK